LLGLIGAGAASAIVAACSSGAPPSNQAPAEQPTQAAQPTAAPQPTAASQPAQTAAPTPTTAAQPTTAAAAPAPAPGQKTTVRYTMFGHPKIAENIVDVFNKSHPNVDLKFERSEGQGYSEKLSAALAGGNAWDSFRYDISSVLRFGPKGVLAPLDGYLTADKTYPANLYLDGLLDALRANGKLYALPGWCLTMWLFYNKKLFDAAGVAYPTPKTTWEDYVQLAQKLTKSEGGQVTQYGANGWGGWTLPVAQDVWSAGGHFYYNDDLTKFLVDDVAAKVLQDEADLLNKSKVNPSPLNPPSSPVSLVGKSVATELNGDWLTGDNIDAWSADFDCTPTPLRDGKRTNVYQPDGLVINNQSQVKDAAYQWISWWSADPASWALQGAIVFPTTKRMYEDENLSKTWLRSPRPPGLVQFALDHVKEHKIWRIEPHANEFESKVYYPEMDKVWHGKEIAKQGADVMTQKGNEIMAKPIS
jgi:multiple sugar transport system substrate-binding protein